MRRLRTVLFLFFAFLAQVSPIVPTAAQAQSAPIAAPTGAPAQVHDLDSPPSAPAAGPVFDAGHGLSVVSVFLKADPVVKGVLIVLLAASLWSWTIIINKSIQFSVLRARAQRFERTFWSGQSLDELYQQFATRVNHPMSAAFVAALREWRKAFENGAPRESQLPAIKDRIDRALNATILRESDGMERQLGILATIGSNAPFIGLFGTVWGIMNAFTAIAAEHNTTLTVVAPAIAEALIATAMGLFAAIPASIFYNRFVGEIGRYATRLDAFADEFAAILSRQLDEKAR